MKDKLPAKDFNMRPIIPQVTRLNKKLIIVICGAVGLVVLLSIKQGLTKKQNKQDAVKQEVKINKFTQLPPEIEKLPPTYKDNIVPQAPVVQYSTAGYQAEQPVKPTPLESDIMKEEEKSRQSGILFSLNNTNTTQQQAADNGRIAIPPQPQTANQDLSIDPGAAQNMQAQKKEFLKDTGKKDVYMDSLKQKPVTDYQVNAGTIIPASLITGINSDLPGDIIAQVRENIYDSATGNYLLIPQGTKLVGEYDSNVSYGQSRVVLIWKRLEFPNSSTLMLSNLTGSDLSGYAGLSDQVDNHTFKLMTAVLFSSLLNVTANQVDKNGNTVSGAFAADAAQGVNRSAQEIVKKQLNVQPTIMIRPGYSFNVIVNKNIAVGSYK